MKASYTIAFVLCLSSFCKAQEFKRLNNWSIGFSPVVKFDFNNSNFLIDSIGLQALSAGNACISDTTGDLLFFTSSYALFTKDGQLMNNGLDINCPFGNILSNYYSHRSPFDQTSIILPKKGNTYYVFSTGMSDSVATNYINHVLSEFDVLNYSVVDMDSNGGLGKVVQKNVVLADKQHYYYTQLSAVKHSNGKDWWLVKADCNNNRYQEFLVKEDTILGPYYQNITAIGGFCTASSQIYFSEDGTKMANTMYGNIDNSGSSPFYYYNRVDLYDFDRCSGAITYKKYYIAPYDTSTYINRDFRTGICFSPDSKLLYMSTNYSIFQIDLEDTNTNNALYIHGPDTTDLDYFPLYGTMGIAPNGKIYVGNSNGTRKYMSYIDSPNVKGLGCSFIPQGVWQPYTNLMSPPNMPNYGLGIDSSNLGCWPLLTSNLLYSNSQLVIYPNPVNSILYIKNVDKKKKEFYNYLGQLVFSTKENEIDVSRLNNGLYYLKCDGEVKKVLKE